MAQGELGIAEGRIFGTIVSNKFLLLKSPDVSKNALQPRFWQTLLAVLCFCPISLSLH